MTPKPEKEIWIAEYRMNDGRYFPVDFIYPDILKEAVEGWIDEFCKTNSHFEKERFRVSLYIPKETIDGRENTK